MKPWYSGYAEHALRYCVYFEQGMAKEHKTKAEERLYNAANKALKGLDPEERAIMIAVYSTPDRNEAVNGITARPQKAIWNMIRNIERQVAINGGLLEGRSA